MNNNNKCIPLYGRLSQSGGSGSGGGGGIIPTGTKEINITENGTTEYDVTPYATAAVTVDVQKTGSKDIDITANGTTTENVQDVGSVNINVNVPTEKPTGSKAFEFTQNGEYPTDVADIATANISVNVPTETPTGSKALTYTANGTYSEDVAAVATADIEVNVPQPAGSTIINVNANGESDHDVTDYATAHVVVDVPKPTAKKTVEITENGTTTEDVADFGSVDITVNVAGQAADDWKDIFEKFIAGNGQTVKELTLDSSSVRSYAFYGALLPDTVTLRYASQIGRYGFAESDVKTVNIPNAETISENSFNSASSLVTINAEALKTIEQYALHYCYRLATINAPNLNQLSTGAIDNCPMKELYFPKLRNLSSQALSYLRNLKKVTFGDVRVQSSSISNCNALEILDVKTSSSIFIPKALSKALIIRDITAVPTMENTVAELKDTLNVYVPDDLVDAFKAATNWSAFGDRIKPLSTYVES